VAVSWAITSVDSVTPPSARASSTAPAAGGIDLANPHWSNFVTAWQEAGFSQYLKSSVIITGSVVVLGTVVAILSGYAFGVLS
jgi:ABC-type glycerol-3-phosphate transport system permease component